MPAGRTQWNALPTKVQGSDFQLRQVKTFTEHVHTDQNPAFARA
jgi:hypothetical protein